MRDARMLLKGILEGSGSCGDPQHPLERRGRQRGKPGRGRREGKGKPRCGAAPAVLKDEERTRPYTRISREMNPDPAKSKPGKFEREKGLLSGKRGILNASSLSNCNARMFPICFEGWKD